MSTYEPIGLVQTLEIWHDNTGGQNAGWNLSHVVIVDLQDTTW